MRGTDALAIEGDAPDGTALVGILHRFDLTGIELHVLTGELDGTLARDFLAGSLRGATGKQGEEEQREKPDGRFLHGGNLPFPVPAVGKSDIDQLSQRRSAARPAPRRTTRPASTICISPTSDVIEWGHPRGVPFLFGGRICLVPRTGRTRGVEPGVMQRQGS